jgi:hypothetical protein
MHEQPAARIPEPGDSRMTGTYVAVLVVEVVVLFALWSFSTYFG